MNTYAIPTHGPSKQGAEELSEFGGQKKGHMEIPLLLHITQTLLLESDL